MASNVETFFTHRQRMQEKVQRLFERYPQHVDKKDPRQLNSGNSHLHRTSPWGEFDIKIWEEEKDGDLLVQKQKILFSFGNSWYVEFSANSMQGADIRVRYGDLDETGTVKLPDETEIKSFNFGQSKTIYSFRRKSILPNASGVQLLVDKDEGAQALIVRDDPSVAGLLVPVDLNVYREVDKFEELLKRK